MKNSLRYWGGFIAGSSSVDQGSGNLSAFNIVDQVTIDVKSTDPLKNLDSEEKLVVPLQLQVITMWKRNNVKDLGGEVQATVEVEIKDANSKSLQVVPINFSIPPTAVRARYILTVNGLPVTKTGEYTFEFREVEKTGKKSETLGRMYMDVIINRK